MRENIDTILSLAAFGLGCFSFGYSLGNHHKKPVEETIKVIIDTTRTDEWDSLKRALIAVESEGNDLAYNETSGATGCLQITDIYVKEVNRLLAEERYTMEDAYDREKSLEMFEVYQAHKNPDKDIRKAIKLHNPRAGEWYTTRVINAMN